VRVCAVTLCALSTPNRGVCACEFSGQKLKYTELQKEKMRKRLSRNKRATFTYSQAFQSLTVAMVNEDEIAAKEKAQSRKKWTTERGFLYPAAKDPVEYRKHPRDVSDARKADLRERWEDPNLPAITVASSSDKPSFNPTAARSMVFGCVLSSLCCCCCRCGCRGRGPFAWSLADAVGR
jgi:hypothetical protein